MTTHLNKQGNAKMVDVSGKGVTKRIAKAMAIVAMNDEAYQHVKEGYIKKGDILGVSQVAGVMAAKNTSNIIPLCHPIALSHVDVTYTYDDVLNELMITSFVSCEGKTGVEMEALTAVTVTALTIYDMLKSVDKSIVIKEIKLLEKQGGKSGEYRIGN